LRRSLHEHATPPLPRRFGCFEAARRSRRRRAWAGRLQAAPLAVALLLGWQAAWAQTYYRAQALPDLQPQGPGGQGWTRGWALNDSGVVVGQTGGGAAVRWSFLDGLQQTGQPAIAMGLTNNGTAVGFLDTVSSAGVIPVRWSPTFGYQPLSDVYAGAPAKGYAVAVNPGPSPQREHGRDRRQSAFDLRAIQRHQGPAPHAASQDRAWEGVRDGRTWGRRGCHQRVRP